MNTVAACDFIYIVSDYLPYPSYRQKLTPIDLLSNEFWYILSQNPYKVHLG